MRFHLVSVCFALAVAACVVLGGCAAPSPTASPLERTIHLSALPSPTPIPDRYAEGLALRRAGDVQGAMEAFSQALVLDPAFAPARIQRAALYLAQGEAEAALADAQAAVAAEPQNGTAYALLGEVLYLGFGDAVQGLEAYERALELDPTLADVTFRTRWRATEAAGRSDWLVSLAGAYADAHPDDPLAAYYKGRALLATGNSRAAIRRLVEVLQEGGPAAVWFVLGQAYGADGAWSQARVCFEQARALAERGDPTVSVISETPTVALLVGLGTAYVYTGECANGRVALQQALAEGADRPAVRTLLGQSLICELVPTPTPMFSP